MAQRELQWSPTMEIVEGLKQTLEFFRERLGVES
jgi:nucleoside-diphosphate-sugar epimerase